MGLMIPNTPQPYYPGGVYIVGAKRTPISAQFGTGKKLAAWQYVAPLVDDMVGSGENAIVTPDMVDYHVMGNVISAGQSQTPARRAGHAGGLPWGTDCHSVEMVCGSGARSIWDLYCDIKMRDVRIGIASGAENMGWMVQTQVTPEASDLGMRTPIVRNETVESLYDNFYGTPMFGLAVQQVAKRRYSREHMDEFGARSYTLARAAIERGRFKQEIVPIPMPNAKFGGEVTFFDTDEEPYGIEPADLGKQRDLGGGLTAALCSKVSNGGSAMMLARQDMATELGLHPLAEIVAYDQFAHDARWFTEAPCGAVNKLFSRLGVSPKDVDLWEINEAFAPVPMSVCEDYEIPWDKVNVNGGAIALGHPIGCSGNRIAVTLIHNLFEFDKEWGVVLACIGGGRAVIMLIRRIATQLKPAA